MYTGYWDDKSFLIFAGSLTLVGVAIFIAILIRFIRR